MTDSSKQLLKTALQLPISERGQIAAELIDSLTAESDADVDDAWADEIERRLKRSIVVKFR